MSRPRRRLRTSVRLAWRLTEREYRQCSQLTLRYDGVMLEALEEAHDMHDDVPVIQVRDMNRRLLGWAILIPTFSDLMEVHVYVRARDRRRGVGTLLMRRAERIVGGVGVRPWDDVSRAFYRPFVESGKAICAGPI
jgi:L-amino acid N-acyltransferase YncA